MIEPHGGTQTKIDKSKAAGRERCRETHGNGNEQKLEALELDHNLILRAQRLTTGATVHRFSQALTVYIGNVHLWNRFIAQGHVSPGEVEEKIILRDRALALQLQLRQEILKEELRSIGAVTGQFS